MQDEGLGVEWRELRATAQPGCRMQAEGLGVEQQAQDLLASNQPC
jgi:hypothetical protein